MDEEGEGCGEGEGGTSDGDPKAGEEVLAVSGVEEGSWRVLMAVRELSEDTDVGIRGGERRCWSFRIMVDGVCDAAEGSMGVAQRRTVGIPWSQPVEME